MALTEERERERQKYVRAYGSSPLYRMKGGRMIDAQRDLTRLPCRGSLLDVSCGRGELMGIAKNSGFDPVMGTEIVPELIGGNVTFAEVHALPFEDKSFDVVTMFDVIEHLIRGDDEAACLELARVARKHVLISANNRPSFNSVGDDLHINRRPYEEWDALFGDWFPGKVTWIRSPRAYVSETWRIDL